MQALVRLRSSRRSRAVALRALAFALFLLTAAGSGQSWASSVEAEQSAMIIRSTSVTNVTDTRFTVNWVTDKPLPGSGSVQYGTSASSLTQSAVEVSPVSGAVGDVHTVTVRNLAPSTVYYYSIVDAGMTANNGGAAYQVTTGKTISSGTTNRTVTGHINQASSTNSNPPAVGVLVTMQILDNTGLNGGGSSQSAPMSTLTDSQGNWSLSLNARTSDLSSAFNYNPTSGDYVLVSVEGGSLGASLVQSFPINLATSNQMTVPTITLAIGVVPTDTPVPLGGSATPTLTPSAVSTASPTPTNTAIPPTLTPLPTETPTPTLTPTLVPTELPTFPPIPSPTEHAPVSALATTVGASLQPIASASPTQLPIVVSKLTPTRVPISPTPPVLTRTLPSPVIRGSGAGRRVPLVNRTFTPSRFVSMPTAPLGPTTVQTPVPQSELSSGSTTPAVSPEAVINASETAGKEAQGASPLGRIGIILLLGVLMMAAGITGIVVGLVRQWQSSDST